MGVIAHGICEECRRSRTQPLAQVWPLKDQGKYIMVCHDCLVKHAAKGDVGVRNRQGEIEVPERQDPVMVQDLRAPQVQDEVSPIQDVVTITLKDTTTKIKYPICDKCEKRSVGPLQPLNPTDTCGGVHGLMVCSECLRRYGPVPPPGTDVWLERLLEEPKEGATVDEAKSGYRTVAFQAEPEQPSPPPPSFWQRNRSYAIGLFVGAASMITWHVIAYKLGLWP